MGARSDLPVALIGALLSAGCFEFADPTLPDAGDPAVLQAAIHVSDEGQLHFTGILAPGLTIHGEQRDVANDTIVVNGFAVGPTLVRRNGARSYDFTRSQPDVFTRPLSLIAPRVDDVRAVPPVIQWPTLRRLGPDTLLLQPGADLVLQVTRTGVADPAPQLTSWSLDLVGSNASVRIGATGAPPDTVRVPSYFVPPTTTGRLLAVLTYFQSAVYRPAPGDYILNLTSDVRVRWSIRLNRGAP